MPTMPELPAGMKALLPDTQAVAPTVPPQPQSAQ
jgi:hypothetical protein